MMEHLEITPTLGLNSVEDKSKRFILTKEETQKSRIGT